MLIKCSECGGQVSDKAAMCPHCGAPVAKAVAGSFLIAKESKISDAEAAKIISSFENSIAGYVDGAKKYSNCARGNAGAVLRDWETIGRKIDITVSRFDTLADRVAIAACQCMSDYVQFSGSYDFALAFCQRAKQFARGTSACKKIEDVCAALLVKCRMIDERYGKRRLHPMEEEMKFLKLEIGTGALTPQCCKTCEDLGFHKNFIGIKTWVCLHGCTRKDFVARKIELTDVCAHYVYKYPRPDKLSKAELMRYGIVRHAIAEGYTYVDHIDIKNFGCCEHCKHHVHGGSHTLEGCKLRGDFVDISSCAHCPSFAPASPEYYVRIQD